MFRMTSTDNIIYHPSLVRDETSFDAGIFTAPTVDGDPSQLIVTTSHPGTWTRSVSVDVPWQYVRGTRAPFLLTGDGGSFDATIFTTLDNLVGQCRVPATIAIAIGNGGQDAQGAQRGLE